MRRFRGCKRGQATAIGAVLFLALAILMVSFTQEVFQVQSKMNKVDVERYQEKIVITSAYIDSIGRLVLNVTNQGSVTANLLRLWVVNQTDNDFLSFDFSNVYIAPGASISNVSNVGFILGKSYAIRVVTERGNIASYNLAPSVQARINIIASASNLIGTNTTIILAITNNDTSGNNLYDVVPVLNISPISSLQNITAPNPTPAKIELLPPGATAFFTYTYKVTGSGFTISLNGSFTRAPSGNYANATIYATVIDVGREVTTMPVFDLDAFGSVPALLDPSTGVFTYWGIALVNPYNRPITVYSVGIIATTSPLYAPGTLVGIHPVGGWYALSTSIFSGVFWESTSTSPIVIPPMSAYNFTFRIRVTAPSGGIIETPINLEAITTEGKFIKSFTTSSDNTFPAINLYLTETPGTPTISKTYAIVGIPPSSTRTYNLAIYNSGKNDLTSKINLLILVPVGWANVVSLPSQTGWNPANVTQQDDGSWLIAVETSSSFLADDSAVVYQFSATAPAVTSTTLYNLAVTAYYPNFSPSITSAYLSAAIQIKPP